MNKDNNKRTQRDIAEFSELALDEILKNPKLRQKLYSLIKKGEITRDSVVFFYGGDELIRRITGKQNQVIKKANKGDGDTPPFLRVVEKTQSSLPTKEKIDGRDLTPNEAKFAEWASEKFDSGEWLKKYKLIL